MAASTKTMLDIVTRAMRRGGLIRVDQTPDASEADEILTALNGMMHNWRNSNVDTTHVTLALGGTFPLDEKYEEGVAAMLLVEVADENGVALKPKTIQVADDCWKSLMAQYLDIDPGASFDPALANMPSQRILLGT